MDEQEESLVEEVDHKILLRDICIFDRQNNFEAVPAGFQAATLYLNAKPSSSLYWKEEIDCADSLIASGHKVVFELDLGLFADEFRGVTHQAQFQTSVLAIDQFRLRILQRFYEHTVGVILHRSQGCFMSFDERDVQMDYLDLVRAELPDALCTFLLFDCKKVQDPYLFSRFFALDRYASFVLALAHAPVALNVCSWKQGQGMLGYIGREEPQSKPLLAKVGLLMPRFDAQENNLEPIMKQLIEQNLPFRIIPEDFLPLEWEELDELIVHKKQLKASTLRAISGFGATGGLVSEV